MATNQRWGSDLRLLTNLEQQNERDRGRDLSIIERQTTGQVDLETLTELDNLRQALLLRFLTPVGELEALGHPDYGSRLFDLIGEPNTPTNRNRAKMYVLQALAQEPRVAEIVSVDVTTRATDRSRIDIYVRLKPITVDTVLNLVFPFFLEQ